MYSSRVVIGVSICKVSLLCVASIIMDLACLFVVIISIIYRKDTPIVMVIAWDALCMFGMWLFAYPAVMTLAALIKKDPVVVLDNDGFSLPAGLRRRQPEHWRWKDVVDIQKTSYRTNTGILVKLTAEAHASRKRDQWQSIDLVFLDGKTSINTTYADRSNEEIEAIMRKYWQAAK